MMKGLYVHIPFCVRKCRYCDFVSFSDCGGKIDIYLEALSKEAEEYARAEIDTVFIGGGTPSVLSAVQLDRLFDIINTKFVLAPNCEFTTEVNPGTVNDDKITAMLHSGVNRVSIGVQSFDDKELTAIGRVHTSLDAADAVWRFHRAGFENISIDLMLSIPHQTLESLSKTLKTAASLPITHISAYSLILEENTPLYEDYKNGLFSPHDEDCDRDMFAAAKSYLENSGFSRYEISNFSKDGFRSRHNMKYWECKEYIGLGLAAHSYIDRKRFYNTASLDKYLNGTFDRDITPLTDADMISEFMIMGLRMTKGVSEREFFKRFGKNIEDIYAAQLKKFTDMSLIQHRNGRYFLTDRGMDVSNSVLCEFII